MAEPRTLWSVTFPDHPNLPPVKLSTLSLAHLRTKVNAYLRRMNLTANSFMAKDPNGLIFCSVLEVEP